MSGAWRSDFKLAANEDLFYELVQRAREASAESDHQVYKVGASMLSITSQGEKIWRNSANKIPERLKRAGILSDISIAGSHPTAHGEFLLFLEKPPEVYNFLGCNKCLCPTCVGKSALYPVDALIYDARTFADPETKERFFEGWHKLGLPIAAAARIPVFKADPDKREIKQVLKGLPPAQRPGLPPLFVDKVIGVRHQTELNEMRLLKTLQEVAEDGRANPAALLIGRTRGTMEAHVLGANECSPPGFSPRLRTELSTQFCEHRYRPDICPVTRLMIEASRRNLDLEEGMLVANFLPRGPRQIDLAACGITTIVVPCEAVLQAEHEKTEAYYAMKFLYELGIMDYAAPDTAYARAQPVSCLLPQAYYSR